jgi:hypothetical protein
MGSPGARNVPPLQWEGWFRLRPRASFLAVVQ